MDEDCKAASRAYDVLVLGAGYAGVMSALRLRRRRPPLRVALIGERDSFLERIRLQEAIVRPVPARLPSLSALIAGSDIDFIQGRVIALDAGQRRATVIVDGGPRELAFRYAIYALGSTIDLERIAGAADHAFRLDPGDGPRSVAALREELHSNAGQRLKVVAIGGAETSIEVAGEIKTAWPEFEVTMVSRTRCGEFRGARVEQAVRAELSALGVRLIDGETVVDIGNGTVTTESGRTITCDLCVLSAGLRAPDIARAAGLATDAQGRVWVGPNLRSISHPHILAVGDAAHPLAPTGAPYRPSAFAAVVSGAYAADVIALGLEDAPPPFSFSYYGQGVAIGRHGVGIFSYPDDQPRGPLTTGKTARHIRNFFVWLLLNLLKKERRNPGSFTWPGRQRVSWNEARIAMRTALPPTAARQHT